MRYISYLRYLIIVAALACTACGTALPTIKPYKLDIQQGNVVTSKMLLQLRPGMTKSQVRYIMGTPLIQDSFHGNRWDYVYQMRERGKVIEQRRVILDFESELLSKVRGDVTPSASDKSGTEAGATNIGTRTINPSNKPAEKSTLDKLKFWKRDEVKPNDQAESIEQNKPETEEAPAPATKHTMEVLPGFESENSPTPAIPTEPSSMQISPDSGDEVKSILAVPMTVPLSTPTTSPAETTPAEKKTAPSPKVISPAKPVEKTKEIAPKSQAIVPEKAAVSSKTKAETTAPAANQATENEDLPPEDSPSFFDKMLEKIGF
jgi:outer membrane protein assembly factor BamE